MPCEICGKPAEIELQAYNSLVFFCREHVPRQEVVDEVFTERARETFTHVKKHYNF